MSTWLILRFATSRQRLARPPPPCRRKLGLTAGYSTNATAVCTTSNRECGPACRYPPESCDIGNRLRLTISQFRTPGEIRSEQQAQRHKRERNAVHGGGSSIVHRRYREAYPTSPRTKRKCRAVKGHCDTLAEGSESEGACWIDAAGQRAAALARHGPVRHIGK